ncbi:IS110 family transposase [Caballeronia insecticola]|uniref:Transposase for insertion sequence element IS1328 n=1 Tax=Caballeronia insecticola TaxID=758793 RepID=R4WGY8_9BURK|nr:transposase for insertion sequence element IS1328 [Caballeronia insecticola]
MAGDVHGFKRGRDFAASLGLVPRQHSTGGRATLPGIPSAVTNICEVCWCTVRAGMRFAKQRSDALDT